MREKPLKKWKCEGTIRNSQGLDVVMLSSAAKIGTLILGLDVVCGISLGGPCTLTDLLVSLFHFGAHSKEDELSACMSRIVCPSFLQVLVQKQEYFRNGWNNLCLVIICVGLLDIIIGFTLPAVYGEDHNAVAVVIVIFLLMRIIRLFRLLEVSINKSCFNVTNVSILIVGVTGIIKH